MIRYFYPKVLYQWSHGDQKSWPLNNQTINIAFTPVINGSSCVSTSSLGTNNNNSNSSLSSNSTTSSNSSSKDSQCNATTKSETRESIEKSKSKTGFDSKNPDPKPCFSS